MPTDQSTFTYDSRSRLTSATYGGVLRNFVYDRYGNLTTNGPQSWTVDPLTNHITLGSFGSPQYDGRGNLTYYNGETMSYDSLDRIYYDSRIPSEARAIRRDDVCRSNCLAAARSAAAPSAS